MASAKNIFSALLTGVFVLSLFFVGINYTTARPCYTSGGEGCGIIYDGGTGGGGGGTGGGGTGTGGGGYDPAPIFGCGDSCIYSKCGAQLIGCNEQCFGYCDNKKQVCRFDGAGYAKCVNTECTDTDAAPIPLYNQHYEYGVATDKNGVKYKDKCSDNNLIENSCMPNGTVESYFVTCLNGCENGACKRQCDDTDKTNMPLPDTSNDSYYLNYYEKGTATNYKTNVSETDSCQDNKFLIEKYCKEKEIKTEIKKCPFGCDVENGVCREIEYACRITADGYSSVETYKNSKLINTEKCSLDCETCAPSGTQDSIRAQACSPALGGDLVFYSNDSFTCHALPDGSSCENPVVASCSLKSPSDKAACGLPSPVEFLSSETVSVCRAGKCKREEINAGNQSGSISIVDRSQSLSFAEKIRNFFSFTLSTIGTLFSDFIASIMNAFFSFFSATQTENDSVKAANNEESLCYTDLNVYGGEDYFSALNKIFMLSNVYLIDPSGTVIGRAYGNNLSRIYIKTKIDDTGREVANEWSEDGITWTEISLIRSSISPETSGKNPHYTPKFQENIDLVKNLYMFGYSDDELKNYLKKYAAERMGYSSRIAGEEGLPLEKLPDGTFGVSYRFIKDGPSFEQAKQDCLLSNGVNDLEQQKTRAPKNAAVRLKLAKAYKTCLHFDLARSEYEEVLSLGNSNQKAEANNELVSLYLIVATRMASVKDNTYLMVALQKSCSAAKLNPAYEQGKVAMQKALLSTILRAYIGRTDESAAKLLELSEALNLAIDMQWLRAVPKIPTGVTKFDALIEQLNRYKKIDNDIIKGIALLKLMLDNGIDPVKYINADISKQQDILAGLIEPGVEPPHQDTMEIVFRETANQGKNIYCKSKVNPRARWNEMTTSSSMMAEYRLIYLQDYEKNKYQVYYAAKKLRESVNKIVLLSDIANVLSCGDVQTAKKLRDTYLHLDAGKSMQECRSDPQLFQKRDSDGNLTDIYRVYFKFQANEPPYANDDKFTGSMAESTIMFLEESVATIGVASAAKIIKPFLFGTARFLKNGKIVLLSENVMKNLYSKGKYFKVVAEEGEVLKRVIGIPFDEVAEISKVEEVLNSQLVFLNQGYIDGFVARVGERGGHEFKIAQKDGQLFLSSNDVLLPDRKLVLRSNLKGGNYISVSKMQESLETASLCRVQLLRDSLGETFPKNYFTGEKDWRGFLMMLADADDNTIRAVIMRDFSKGIDENAKTVLARAIKILDSANIKREITIIWDKTGKPWFSIGDGSHSGWPLGLSPNNVSETIPPWRSHVGNSIPTGQFIDKSGKYGDFAFFAERFKNFEIGSWNTAGYSRATYLSPTKKQYTNLLKNPVFRTTPNGLPWNQSLMDFATNGRSLVCELLFSH